MRTLSFELSNNILEKVSHKVVGKFRGDIYHKDWSEEKKNEMFLSLEIME
jgi:hypothetical protein